MKKLIFTLVLLLSVFALSAQSFIVTEKESGNVVETLSTYYVWGDGSEFSWGYPGGQLEAEFKVEATDNIDIVCAKFENNDIPGTTNDLCLGACYTPTTTVTPPKPMAQGEIWDFSVHYQAEDYLTVLGQQKSMTYHLYDNNNPEVIFVLNVFFMYSYESINDYSSAEVFSNAYPMPARDVVNFDYNFATSVIGEVAIFNMMGQEVMRSEISGMQGKASINVSDLADGIYFYSLIINGKTEKSNKLIIRK